MRKRIVDYQTGQEVVTETTWDIATALAYQTARVKGLASQIILDRFETWRQLNANMRATELLKKGAATWTPEEVVEAKYLEAIAAWIKAVRAASDVIEAELAEVQDPQSILDVNISGHGAWPEGFDEWLINQ